MTGAAKAPPGPPAGYTVRAATPADQHAVAEMLGASDVHDWGEPDYSETMLASDWSQPGLDLATDTWLALDGDGMVAGYAWQLARAEHTKLDGWGDVHPDHRGRGIGSFLLDAMERRAGEHRALAPGHRDVDLQVDTIGTDDAVHRMLEARGFERVRQFWRMDADLAPAMPAHGPPPGITIRPFLRDRDARSFHATIDESFADHWGWVSRTFEEWSAHRFGDEGFDAGLWFVALEHGEIVGALMGSAENGSTGWVNSLGVRRPWRGRGIGEALLRTAFAAFSGRGLEHAALGVDSENETGATRLYERAGMHVSRRYDAYRKILPAPGA